MIFQVYHGLKYPQIIYQNIKLLYNTRKIFTTKSVLAIFPNHVMYVFDRNSKFLQRERAAKAFDVNIYDYIKDEIGCRLSDRIFDIKRKFKKVLDLGCGRGHVSKYILKDFVNEIILADLSPSWLKQAQAPEGVKVEKRILDEENFLLESDSFDFIISCLSLHWVNDLPGCFNCIINSLIKDGVFMAALFGAETLYELRTSLQLAELERDGGVSPHISPFTDIKDIGSLLTNAGFSMITIDTEELVIGYSTIFQLMWDLKGMGEGNAVKNRKLHLKRETIFAASAIYDQLYGKIKEDGNRYIPATFQVIYLIGWKPDESQPKPIKRGTGEISLKDIYRIDEIVKEKTNIKVLKNKK